MLEQYLAIVIVSTKSADIQMNETDPFPPKDTQSAEWSK